MYPTTFLKTETPLGGAKGSQYVSNLYFNFTMLICSIDNYAIF